MRWKRFHTGLVGVGLLAALPLLGACEIQYIPTWLGGGPGTFSPVNGTFAVPTAFTEELVQGRTFTNGTASTTTTYLVDDIGGTDNIAAEDVLHRTPFGIDFNGDGKIDPVVGYGFDQAVIQILLSDPSAGANEVSYISLTLDSKRDMEDLADVAVGDIDRDGALDIVAAASGAVWYFHHPTGQPTTALYLWGNTDPNDDLRERIDSSYEDLSDAEILSMVTQAIGVGINLADYQITLEQLYTNVEIGDMDNDGDNDVVASRSFTLTLTPRPNVAAEIIQIVDGDVIAFINPGFAVSGHNWSAVSLGGHERQQRLDRDAAGALLLYDIDDDGDLDVISAARQDNNVQVAWFENPVDNRVDAPGAGLSVGEFWDQWRIGSVRDVRGMDIADINGDGRVDVVATGGEQMQMMLFEQPATGPRRAWDWDSYAIVTFDSLEPRDVKVFDVDEDGELEIVVGGTGGALRYCESTGDVHEPWDVYRVLDFDPAGEVGLLGYGDLDGDGDLDIVAVIDGDEDNASRVSWVRNETVSTNP